MDVKTEINAGNTLNLSKPVKAHGEEISILTLREPTGKDAREIGGLPYSMGTDQKISLDLDIVAKYASRLAGVPTSTIDQLSATDFNSLAWMVAGFFMRGESAQ